MMRKRLNNDKNGSGVEKTLLIKTETKNQNENAHITADPSIRNGVYRKPEVGWVNLCFRRLYGICKWVLLIIIIPPFLNFAALQKETTHLKPEVGQLYDIGSGQKLYLSCLGQGHPTVILDAPTGMSSDVWIPVQRRVAMVTRVCVYDRAGLGFSDRPGPTQEKSRVGAEFTLERMVEDLRTLITANSPQASPLVLVGAEMGALVARFYAQLYDNDVSDVIMVDPLVEELLSLDAGVWNKFWFGQLVPAFQALQLGAASGVSRLALLLGLLQPPIDGAEFDDVILKRQKYLLCHPRHLSSAVDEHFFINASLSQMKTLNVVRTFPSNVSVMVVNGNYYDQQLPSPLNKAFAKAQQHLISHLHPNTKHVVVNGGDHTMIYKTPDMISEPIIRTVKQRRAHMKNNVKR